VDLLWQVFTEMELAKKSRDMHVSYTTSAYHPEYGTADLPQATVCLRFSNHEVHSPSVYAYYLFLQFCNV
jgi:hypothetical protein